jgi:RNA polymerase subunit RPABC4/transcription elongation factor Spt4
MDESYHEERVTVDAGILPRMGMLTVAKLEETLSSGCSACAGTSLRFRAYVDAGVPMMAAEPVGKLYWAYDGEKFVDGVFEIACTKCSVVLFASDVCPRCHGAGGLEVALEAENAYPAPKACPRCAGQEVRLIAFVPAKVSYEGKRADKAQTAIEPHDPGFHGYRVDCKSCGTVAELRGRCPLCASTEPLRPRPE